MYSNLLELKNRLIDNFYSGCNCPKCDGRLSLEGDIELRLKHVPVTGSVRCVSCGLLEYINN
jgi:Zn ribbon nucleic-acid-binding protein